MTESIDAIAIARIIELTEATAWADLLAAAPADWRAIGERTPAGWLLSMPTADMMLFNRLVGCGVDGPVSRDALDAAVTRLRAAGVRNYAVQLSPAAQPAAIRDWLAEAGLAPRDRWTKVYRGPEPAAAMTTALRIERADVEQAGTFGEVVTTGFGMPPLFRPWLTATVGRPGWRHYLAWDGETAVAGAALYVHGDAGWLGAASTLPAARGRGAQRALMARRIEDGRALGCRRFVTETGEDTPARPNPSFRNMMRAGFTVAYQRENFMTTP
jgi:GNAT superfamily N-acetyltransferase